MPGHEGLLDIRHSDCDTIKLEINIKKIIQMHICKLKNTSHNHRINIMKTRKSLELNNTKYKNL